MQLLDPASRESSWRRPFSADMTCDSTKPTRQNRLNRWVNLRDVNDLASRFGTTNEHGKLVLDLRSIGYDKLLGGGTLLKPIVVRVAKVSAIAKQKIELAGGDIVLNEEVGSK
jgi:large subunit ribosomal protein L15